jgi:hypothetical protein
VQYSLFLCLLGLNYNIYRTIERCKWMLMLYNVTVEVLYPRYCGSLVTAKKFEHGPTPSSGT